MGDKVVIVVDSKSFEVSKRQLTERSRYFNSMFNGEFLERNQPIINIQGVDRSAWEEILFFVETGKMRPKPMDSDLHRGILKLLETSDMLLFPDVRELCLRSLVEVLSAENAFEILEVACNLEIESLIRKARAIALWNADVITCSEGFYKLEVEHVESYLSDPGLHTSNGEWGVWEAVNRWIIAGLDLAQSRTEYLPRLIQCVSLKGLSKTELRKINSNESVRSHEVVSAAVRSALVRNSARNVIAPEVDDFLDRWRSMPQRRLPLVPAVVAKITVNSSSPSPYIIQFSLENRRFTPVLRLDQVETNLNSLVGFKVIADGSKLYMLGGEIMTRQVSWYLAVWEYDQILGHWNFLANLRKETRHAAACVLGNFLYVIGGFGRHRIIQDTVSKLNLRDKQWTTCSPLPRPMYALPCCAFKGKIFAIKTEVHQYDPVLDMWEVLDIDLPAGDVFCFAVANDEFIYIAGLQKTVYKFDPTQRNSFLLRVGKFVEDCTQACLVDDYLYNMAQSSFGNDLTCERMNIRSGQREILWRGAAGHEIDTFSPNHHHGCFPLLYY